MRPWNLHFKECQKLARQRNIKHHTDMHWQTIHQTLDRPRTAWQHLGSVGLHDPHKIKRLYALSV